MTVPLKRQPRGEEPLAQKSYKLPERCIAYVQRMARMGGETEARALKNIIDRDMQRHPVFDERAESEVA